MAGANAAATGVKKNASQGATGAMAGAAGG